MLVFPVLLIVALFLVPFVSNRGERAPSRRPVAVLSVIVIYTVLGILTYEGNSAPWSPVMTAWSGDPIPASIVKRSTPLELAGRGRVSEQELPELSRASTASADAGALTCRLVGTAPHARPTHRPGQQRHARSQGSAGRRRDAGLRQANRSLPDDGARRLSDRAFVRRDSRPAEPAAQPDRRKPSSHESRVRRVSAILAIQSAARRSRWSSRAAVYVRGWLALHHRAPRPLARRSSRGFFRRP